MNKSIIAFFKYYFMRDIKHFKKNKIILIKLLKKNIKRKKRINDII